MTITEVTNESAWNNFVLRQQPNTFLHSWEWGQAQKRTGESVRCLGLYDNQQQIGACLLLTINARRGRHYLIPHGPLFLSSLPLKRGGGQEGVNNSLPLKPAPRQSYSGRGGGLPRSEAPGFYYQGQEGVNKQPTISSCLYELCSYLRGRARRDRVVALRIAPLLENTAQPLQLFRSLGFRPAPLHVHAELTWMLDITPPEEQLLAAMRKTTRHAIRRAENAGITSDIVSGQAVRQADVINRFFRLYTQTKTRHHFVPYSRATLAAQLAEFSRHNHVFVAFARHEQRDVAAAVCFQFSRTVFYYHGASLALPASLPASQLVQWAAISEAKRRGASRYNFWGIAPEIPPPQDRTPHPFAGLTIFKKGFGGYAIDYLHAQDLPLSPWYWKLWLIETLRKKKRGF
ncbi:MAG: peptidoglycan bridge formation glycyltransferase FemA/FemB family protein [Candidatus Andersenbacteria bacterium]|nr:peptidoglycan bridge formation glycyltransferase FemA/FemB family protein [Candidatus Andersenbacteria bacterium]